MRLNESPAQAGSTWEAHGCARLQGAECIWWERPTSASGRVPWRHSQGGARKGLRFILGPKAGPEEATPHVSLWDTHCIPEGSRGGGKAERDPSVITRTGQNVNEGGEIIMNSMHIHVLQLNHSAAQQK